MHRPSYRALLFAVTVQGSDPLERGRYVGRFGKVLVSVEANRNSDLGFALSGNFRQARVRPLDHPQDPAAATHAHALAEGDLRRHVECEFDLSSFMQRGIGEEKYPARTEVLGEAETFDSAGRVAQGDRKKERESLTDAAFNLNWRSGHNGSFLNRRGSATATVPELPLQEKFKVSNTGLTRAGWARNPTDWGVRGRNPAQMMATL